MNDCLIIDRRTLPREFTLLTDPPDPRGFIHGKSSVPGGYEVHRGIGLRSKVSFTNRDKIIPSISDEDQHYPGAKVHFHGKEFEVLGNMTNLIFKEAKNLDGTMNTKWQSRQGI